MEIALEPIGRFEPRRRIGRGSMADTYDAIAIDTGDRVLLRRVRWQYHRFDRVREKFLARGRALAAVGGPRLLRIIEVGETDSELYCASELADAPSLRDALGSMQQPWELIAGVLEQLCQALAPLHARGLVHSRLAPRRVFVERRPGAPDVHEDPYRTSAVTEAIMLDLASATMVTSPEDFASDNERRRRTIKPRIDDPPSVNIDYFSPEQLMNKAIDNRSDIYAIGVIAYELATRQRPFPDAVGMIPMIKAVLTSGPQPPSQLGADLPPWFEAVILCCLERETAKRFPSVGALAEAMRGAQRRA
jgi:eukaryotic-like serine/threonine-protein kinase